MKAQKVPWHAAVPLAAFQRNTLLWIRGRQGSLATGKSRECKWVTWSALTFTCAKHRRTFLIFQPLIGLPESQATMKIILRVYRRLWRLLRPRPQTNYLVRYPWVENTLPTNPYVCNSNKKEGKLLVLLRAKMQFCFDTSCFYFLESKSLKWLKLKTVSRRWHSRHKSAS
mgnify:CR=1 FL=1